MKTLCLTLLAGSLVFASGCAHRVEYVESASNDGITTVGDINIQDWNAAAAKSIDSLLASGRLDKAAHQPAVLMVGRVRNDTNQHVDTDLLTKKIRIALNQSGKAVTTTAVGLDKAEDESSYVVRELRNSPEFDQQTVQPKGTMLAPDYSLSGKIIELDSKAGSTRQAAYVFQLSMTDVRTGLAVWENEVQIIKKGRKSGIGW